MKTKYNFTIFVIAIMLMMSYATFGQNKSDVYNYLVKIGCKHPEIVTAQSQLETGHFTSYSCRTRKNLFGLRYDHKFLTFNTWQQSCDAYLSKIQYKYKGGDYYKFLEELGYAADVDYIAKLKRL